AAGMAGAPALAAMAALRSGAGLVEAVVPEPVVAITAGFDPCVMARGLPGAADGTFAAEAVETLAATAARADAVAIGPGMGRSDAVVGIVASLWRDVVAPAVFDADALWALAVLAGDAGGRAALATHAGPRILTPHAGELVRLLGGDPSRMPVGGRQELEREATSLAADLAAVVVLPGPNARVVEPPRRAHNETGNPGMATAGAGDVLTGVVTALVAQGLAPLAAARLGTWVHGRAGDLAAARVGEVSLTAGDVLAHLSDAFREVID
ncbi:MAG: NAD(P)H-hydrate dehydratase, partial [Planctomycetia bacterium]